MRQNTTDLTPEARRARLHAARQQLTDSLADLMPADGRQAARERQARTRRNPPGNLMIILRDGRHTLIGVLDASQLLPAAAPADHHPELLSGDAPEGLWDGVAAQIRARGFTIKRGRCGGANGITCYDTRTVRVRDDVDDAQAAKTLTHELAHIALGHAYRDVPQEIEEIEAESVACIVAAACGLDTRAYSAPYVASWARDLDTATTSAERVYDAADTILARLGVPAAGSGTATQLAVA